MQVTQQLGATGKVSFVGVVPDHLQAPTKEFRAALSRESANIRASAFSIHFAIEGSGVLANLQRGMLTLLAAMVSPGVPFTIHGSGRDALEKAANLRSTPAEDLVAAARSKGLIGAS
jgi:hypothetical protein